MSLEIPKVESGEVLDDVWYQRYSDLAAFESYAMLAGEKQHRNKEKKAFLSGEIENPDLGYPELNIKELLFKEAELRKLKSEILTSEDNEIVAQVYRWRINEKIAELKMLQATVEGNDRIFRRYSEFVYGSPSPDVFAYTIDSVRSYAEEFVGHEDSAVQQVALELVELLPDNMPNVTIAALPSEETVKNAKKVTAEEFSDVLEMADSFSDKSVSAEDIKLAFEQALKTLRLPGWEVVVDKTGKTAISVVQSEKKVIVPENRKLSTQELKELIVHELGTHVARRENGERSKLQLLGLGLDRYEKGEEGIASMRQQALQENVEEFRGLTGHLAIGLAYGLDGNKRDFRGVYNVLEKFFTLRRVRGGKSIEESKKWGKGIAWNRCVRTFRGTTGTTPGACYTKDIIYREGNIDIWRVIGENPDALMSFNVGKYDPANPRHLLVLSMLGIVDSDLDE